MSFLAAPRRKSKCNPIFRSDAKNAWTDDEQKLGKKLLKQMGWSEGKGLGKNLQGEPQPMKTRMKNDSKGIGYKMNDTGIDYYGPFESILSQLNDISNSEDQSLKVPFASNIAQDEEHSITDLKHSSLEKKSKISRSRVHYHKFVRGKDLSKYGANDLEVILGSKQSQKIKKEKVDLNEESEALINVSINGLTTVNRGSVKDYFAEKMSRLQKRTNSKCDSSSFTSGSTYSEDCQMFGLGFNKEHVTCDFLNNCVSSDSLLLSHELSETLPRSGVLDNAEVADSPKIKKKKKRKNRFSEDVVGTEECKPTGRKVKNVKTDDTPEVLTSINIANFVTKENAEPALIGSNQILGNEIKLDSIQSEERDGDENKDRSDCTEYFSVAGGENNCERKRKKKKKNTKKAVFENDQPFKKKLTPDI